jgi:hypothetical protein
VATGYTGCLPLPAYDESKDVADVADVQFISIIAPAATSGWLAANHRC